MNECLTEERLFDPQEYAVSVAATFGTAHAILRKNPVKR